MFLFVDDWRVPPEGWELARTITEAIRILSTEPIHALSLDHDIQIDGATTPAFSDENFSAVARFVACMDSELQPQIIFLHTANHNGAVNMARILSHTNSKIVRISPMSYANDIARYFKRKTAWDG